MNLDSMRWYYQRAVRQAERIEAAEDDAFEQRRDSLELATKLLALSVSNGATEEEAASAKAKALELLQAYAEGSAGVSPGLLIACNANWDKASEHAARAAPYVHHKLVAVDKSAARKLDEMSDEELLAAAEEAEAAIGALVQDDMDAIDDGDEDEDETEQLEAAE